MDEKEIRLRCIEAAAKTPLPHNDGYAAGVLHAAREYAHWVTHGVYYSDRTQKGVDSLL